ncbi:glycosyltransferase family 2 protein [Clostridium thermobutyricum]
MQSRTYVILLNYNTYVDTIECMESFKTNNYENYCIIIVDNCSLNDSIEKIRKWMIGKNFLEVNDSDEEIDLKNNTYILIKSKDNRGFASGNNKAIRQLIKLKSESDNVWILNNDTIIEKNSLEILANEVQENEFLGAILVDFRDKKSIQTMGGFRLSKMSGVPKKNNKNILIDNIDSIKYKDIDFISGASIFMKLDTLKKVGYIPEEYFMYWEDCDWCYMAKKKNIKMSYSKKAIIFHKEGKSIGNRSFNQYELDFKNCLKFFSKYYPQYIKFIIINKLTSNILSALKNRVNVANVLKASLMGIKEYKKEMK